MARLISGVISRQRRQWSDFKAKLTKVVTFGQIVPQVDAIQLSGWTQMKSSKEGIAATVKHFTGAAAHVRAQVARVKQFAKRKHESREREQDKQAEDVLKIGHRDAVKSMKEQEKATRKGQAIKSKNVGSVLGVMDSGVIAIEPVKNSSLPDASEPVVTIVDDTFMPVAVLEMLNAMRAKFQKSHLYATSGRCSEQIAGPAKLKVPIPCILDQSPNPIADGAITKIRSLLVQKHQCWDLCD